MLKPLAVILSLAAFACEQAPSKLDATKPVEGGPVASGDTAERLQRLEATLAKYSDSLEFLKRVYDQQQAQQAQQAAKEHDPDATFAVDVSAPIAAGQIEGPVTAPVTIVKAFDFACPYCMQLNQPLHELVSEYQGKVRVVYMNLVVHPDTAQAAHLYSCAAAKQQKYLAWKDAFWEKGFGVYAASRGREREAMSEDNILKISAELGLDVQQLKTDAHGDECKRRLAEDQTELRKFRVSGTPGLFINGKFIGGAIPKEAFKQIIDEKLKLVDASGVPASEYYEKEIMGKGHRQFRSKQEAEQAKAEKG